jgi:hypothetical protein
MFIEGFEYSIASGRLFCPIDEFQKEAEKLIGHPLMTHQFADEEIWDHLRANIEARFIDKYAD